LDLNRQVSPVGRGGNGFKFGAVDKTIERESEPPVPWEEVKNAI